MKNILQKRWTWGLMTFFAVLIAIVAGVPYLNFDPATTDGVFAGRFIDGGAIWLYIHIVSGIIALATGPFQFLKGLRNRRKRLHRWLGRVYMFAGIFPAAISGLIIAQGTVGGMVGRIGFSGLAIAWFFTGVMALYKILSGDTVTHRNWMIRNYALSFAAVMLRLWLPIGIMVLVPVFNGDFESAFAFMYKVVAWLCWIPNLFVAEMMVAALRPKRESKEAKLISTEAV